VIAMARSPIMDSKMRRFMGTIVTTVMKKES